MEPNRIDPATRAGAYLAIAFILGILVAATVAFIIYP